MPPIDESALTILRVMDDFGITLGNEKSPSEIASITSLEKGTFDNALFFLLNAHCIEGSRDSLYLNQHGIAWLRDKMSARLDLSVDAERILRYVFDQARHPTVPLGQADIIAALGLDLARYETACRMLEDFDFIRPRGQTGLLYGMIVTTKEGRQAVHQNFMKSSVPQMQVGAVFHGPVTGSNIQAVAAALRSNIEQNISQSDPDVLRQEINNVIEELAKRVRDELTMEQQAAYLAAAAELQKEVAKPDPDPGKLHRLRNTIAFGDSLNGTLDLGTKALQLSVIAAPYAVWLGEAIYKLAQSIGS